MTTLQEVLEWVRTLPASQQQDLIRALTRGGRSADLPIAGPTPHSAAWVKSERGHAVLATDLTAFEAALPAGAAAIAGIWAEAGQESAAAGAASGTGAAATTLTGPALVHTDLAVAVARGSEPALALFQTPRIEVRLSTATYLQLLSLARDPEEQARVRRFVSAYPVLSLGPMASSRAVELVQAHALTSGLGPLDALIAATALAHEIPLVVGDPAPFAGIGELAVVVGF